MSTHLRAVNPLHWEQEARRMRREYVAAVCDAADRFAAGGYRWNRADIFQNRVELHARHYEPRIERLEALAAEARAARPMRQRAF